MLRGYIPDQKRRPIGPLIVHPMLLSAAIGIYPLVNRFLGATDEKRGVTLPFGATTAEPHYNSTVYGEMLTFDGADTCGTTITALNPAVMWIAGTFTLNGAVGAEYIAGSLGGAVEAIGAFFLVRVSTAGNIEGQVRKTTAGTAVSVTGPAVVLGNTYHYAFLTRGLTDHVLWVNGTVTRSTSTVTTSTTNMERASIGSRLRQSTFAGHFIGDIGWFAYGGVNDPGEPFLRDLSMNPWKYLYAPQRQDYWWQAQAAGGFQSAWASQRSRTIGAGVI